MPITLVATLVGIVESSMFMFCGFRLVGFAPATKKLLLVAACHALAVRMLRQLFYTVWDIPFGAHIVAAIALFFIFSYWWFKLPAILAAMAVVIGYLLLSLGTMLVLLLLPNLEPTSFGSILSMILVEQSPLILATIIIWRNNVTIIPRSIGEKLGLRT